MKSVFILFAVFSFASRVVSNIDAKYYQVKPWVKLLLCQVFSQEDSQTAAELMKRCKFLNEVRANFTICCEYPLLVMWELDFKMCQEKCASDGEPNDDCCILSCCLFKIGALTQSEGGPIEVDPKGLIYSFLLSVGNDTQWLPVVTKSSRRCYDDIPNTYENNCNNRIPKQLYSIVDCCYIENYLKCAKWNPYDVKECAYTIEYVSTCL